MRKLLSTALVLGVISSTSLTPAVFADVAATALPQLNSATNADVTTNNANMNIQITGGQGSVGTLNWNSYNVGKDATVNYEFSAHNQTAFNKVAATGGLSQIYGKITNSGCANCGYDGTGKVILLNPNGVFFGTSANVDLNSFTVSTMDGTFDKDANKLKLTREYYSPYGIIVEDGANIYGDKNVTFATDNVRLYNGSKISTNIGNNVGDAAYGKIKIVTSDGVNFAYYNNGAVKGIDGIVGAAEKMTVNANGELTAGHIDIRNYSSNADSEINLNGSALKAVKAVKGNDGNIWLTATNKVVIDNSTLDAGNDISVLAGNKSSIKGSTLKAAGDIEAIATTGDSVVNSSKLTAGKDIRITAGNIASAQNSSNLTAQNITINGKKRAQANSSILTATKDVNLVSVGDMVWTDKATIKAGQDINATATNGYLRLDNSTFNADRDVNLTSKDNVTSARLAGTTFTAGRDVNVESTGESILLTGTEQFVPTRDLNLKAAKHIEIKKAEDLTTEKVNMTAGKNIYLTSTDGNVNVKDTTKFVSAEKIYISGGKNVTTTGTVDMNNIQTNIYAGKDINVKLSNVGNRQNGLVASAGDNVTIETPDTLSVSSLISGKDMKIKAKKVIAGLPYTDKEKLNNDYERSYIEVGGEFTSEVTNDNYDITLSGDPTNDGKFNQKHHIQYGENEKILLVNKRPRPVDPTDPNMNDIDNGEGADVINPDSNSDPSPSVDPQPNPDPNPTPDPDPNPNPDPDPNQDCDGDPALDDEIIDETNPHGNNATILSSALLSAAQYAASASSSND